MIEREKRVLLRHYLEQGKTKAAIHPTVPGRPTPSRCAPFSMPESVPFSMPIGTLSRRQWSR